MDMEIYHETNRSLEKCFHTLEEQIPLPVLISYGIFSVRRYQKEHHCRKLAIVQKLARYISGLNASLLLIESGFTQETGVIFRTLDEFREDILFLALPSDDSEVTETHNKYLADFFQEELDNPNNPAQSTQKRDIVPRKKIRAVIANSGKSWLNSHDCGEVSRTISQINSGYVHAPSCHICEMIDGDSLLYSLAGMAGTPRQVGLSYSYRHYAQCGLILVSIAAKSLGNATMREKAIKFLEYFEKTTSDIGSDLDKVMKELKRKIT